MTRWDREVGVDAMLYLQHLAGYQAPRSEASRMGVDEPREAAERAWVALSLSEQRATLRQVRDLRAAVER
jgi:hypothetical protein